MVSSAKAASKPTPRRSRWFAPRPGDWDLAYLGWGVRFFGINPVPLRPAAVWSYQLVLDGNPTLNLGSSTMSTSAGDLFVFAIGCPQGWNDKTERRSELLVWNWKSPPLCNECIPPHAGYLVWKVPPRILRQIQQIHARFRHQVANPDALTPLALQHLRLELELCLARMRLSKTHLSSAVNRLDLAISWMHQNLAVRRPVAFLCDYLQVSDSLLERLFLESVGESPSAYFHRLKMEHAAQLLKQNAMSIKEIAYTLGYTHPNDFSRAFKRRTGRTPEEERNAPPRMKATRGGK